MCAALYVQHALRCMEASDDDDNDIIIITRPARCAWPRFTRRVAAAAEAAEAAAAAAMAQQTLCNDIEFHFIWLSWHFEKLVLSAAILARSTYVHEHSTAPKPLTHSSQHNTIHTLTHIRAECPHQNIAHTPANYHPKSTFCVGSC